MTEDYKHIVSTPGTALRHYPTLEPSDSTILQAEAQPASRTFNICVQFPPRRWRMLLRGRVSPAAIRLLARCKAGKFARWRDFTLEDFYKLQDLGVLPTIELDFSKKGK